MSDKYREVYFKVGNSIEYAVEELLEYKEKGILAYGIFNGITLYSDSVTVDGAYKEITGKTKTEFDREREAAIDKFNREREEHEAKIPDLAKMWMEKGRDVLTEEKWELWDEIVPIRLGDLYRGMELGCCLDIVKILNDNGTLDEAKEKIESQDHSGVSFGLVCAMVREFCERGNEFVDYLK